MTFPPEVWNSVLRRLHSELPSYSIEAWLLPLVAEPDSKGELQLICPTPFHRDRVRDHFLESIVACLRQEVGPDAAVALGLQTDLARNPHAGRATGASGKQSASSGHAITASNATQAADQRASQLTDRPAGPSRPPNPDAQVENTEVTEAGEAPATAGLQATKNARGMRSVRPDQLARPDRARSAAAKGTHAAPVRPARNSARRTSPRSASLTFENFVVGPCNSLAREASFALANEGRGLRQLYLNSPHGLGKTHLSRAVVAEARRQDSARVLYASAESFTSEFMSSIQARTTAGFKQRWRRECDVLVIEDIQFLVGKRATQLELFHTVQHVLDRGRRVLLTGDRPAHALSGLDERVRSQLAGGFAATIDLPDASVRCDILRAKASAGGVRVPDDCLELIVQSISGSIRELEGALIQIVTTASLMKRSIDLTLTRESLDRTSPRPERPRPTPDAIIKAVAAFFQTTPELLASRTRRRDVLIPRQLAMYFSHRYTDASLSVIGHALGRDHPSVRNAISRIERTILERAPLRYKVEALSERLHELGLGDGPATTAASASRPKLRS